MNKPYVKRFDNTGRLINRFDTIYAPDSPSNRGNQRKERKHNNRKSTRGRNLVQLEWRNRHIYHHQPAFQSQKISSPENNTTP